jgi:hypothetical protein
MPTFSNLNGPRESSDSNSLRLIKLNQVGLEEQKATPANIAGTSPENDRNHDSSGKDGGQLATKS